MYHAGLQMSTLHFRVLAPKGYAVIISSFEQRHRFADLLCTVHIPPLRWDTFHQQVHGRWVPAPSAVFARLLDLQLSAALIGS